MEHPTAAATTTTTRSNPGGNNSYESPTGRAQEEEPDLIMGIELSKELMDTELPKEFIEALIEMIEEDPEAWLKDYAERARIVMPPTLKTDPMARFRINSPYTHKVERIGNRFNYLPIHARLHEETLSENLRERVANWNQKVIIEFRIRSEEHTRHALDQDHIEVYYRTVNLDAVVYHDSPWPDRLCSNCGKIAKDDKPLDHCARCKMTTYCDKDCQRNHWNQGGHKKFCANFLKIPGMSLLCDLSNCLSRENGETTLDPSERCQEEEDEHEGVVDFD